MGVSSQNLIQGPATLYIADFGATEPADIATAFGVGWRDVGGTQDGVELAIADEYAVLGVDQVVYEIERRRTGRVMTVKTSLAEATLENLAAAINNTAPTSNSLDLDDGLAAFKPPYRAIGLDGLAPGGFRRRFIARKCLSTDSVAMAYKKDGMTLIPVTFTGHWVSPSVRPLSVKDAVA